AGVVGAGADRQCVARPIEAQKPRVGRFIVRSAVELPLRPVGADLVPEAMQGGVPRDLGMQAVRSAVELVAAVLDGIEGITGFVAGLRPQLATNIRRDVEASITGPV